MHPRELLDRIYTSLDRGDIRHAGPVAEQMVARFPAYAPGWAAFSEVWLRCGRMDEACSAAEKAHRLDCSSAAIAAQQAKCLVFAGDYRQAQEVAETALSLDPADHATLDTLGNVFSRLWDHERALAIFERALELAPDNTTALYNLATSLRFFGRNEEAETLITRVIELDPTDYQALHSRSLLRRQSESSNHVAELRARLESDLPWVARSHLYYALGKELDDLERPSQAFQAYSRGARSMSEHLPDTLPADLENIDAVVEAIDKGTLDRVTGDGYRCDEPIFIVGAPRTGSTLIERILDVHPDVLAAGELQHFQRQALRHLQADSPAAAYRNLAAHAETADVASLGQDYIESTRHRTGQTPKFVDKMPRNDLWAVLIHRALPDARFILTRRDPMDTGYALYRTLFHSGHHFSYDLERIGRYLVAQEELNAALRRALPRNVLLEVEYEDLVQAPEQNVRAIAAHCSLEWREQMLDFHQKGGAVATASSHQVRQPFHTRSIGRWRALESELEPLRIQLERGGIHVKT